MKVWTCLEFRFHVNFQGCMFQKCLKNWFKSLYFWVGNQGFTNLISYIIVCIFHILGEKNMTCPNKMCCGFSLDLEQNVVELEVNNAITSDPWHRDMVRNCPENRFLLLEDLPILACRLVSLRNTCWRNSRTWNSSAAQSHQSTNVTDHGWERMTNVRFKVSFCFAPRCCVCEIALATTICPPFQTCMIHHGIWTSLLYQALGWLSNILQTNKPTKAAKRPIDLLFYQLAIRNLLYVFKYISAQDGVDPFINAEEIFSEASQRIQPHAPRARHRFWCQKVDPEKKKSSDVSFSLKMLQNADAAFWVTLSKEKKERHRTTTIWDFSGDMKCHPFSGKSHWCGW